MIDSTIFIEGNDRRAEVQESVIHNHLQTSSPPQPHMVTSRQLPQISSTNNPLTNTATKHPQTALVKAPITTVFATACAQASSPTLSSASRPSNDTYITNNTTVTSTSNKHNHEQEYHNRSTATVTNSNSNNITVPLRPSTASEDRHRGEKEDEKKE